MVCENGLPLACAGKQAVQKKPAKGIANFPGEPGKDDATRDLEVSGVYWKIYTASRTRKYRCRKVGEKVDKAFSWVNQSPREAWDAMMNHIQKHR